MLDARRYAVRSIETNRGNWLAGVFRENVKADVALINGGGIRSNTAYAPGPLTRRDIMTILPFDNPIIKLRIKGSALRQILAHGLSDIDVSRESGRYPQISGMKVKYDPRRPVGQRALKVDIGDRTLDDAAEYTIAVNDYIGRRDDGYAMLENLPCAITAEDARAASAEAIEYVSNPRTIAPGVEGRIQRID